jgi:putative endonuclease
VSRVKGFASRGRRGRNRADVLRLPVAFHEGQWVLPRKKASPDAVSSFYSSRVFYVYVLRSESDSGFYIGYSTDLKRRLSEHTRGASFATKSRGPWKLIYYEAYTEREDAEGREKFLKSGAGRRFLRAQLRHYLRVKGFASRGSNQDDPTFH